MTDHEPETGEGSLNLEFSLSGLVKSYNGVQALNDLSLEIRRGESLGIIGPSGSGKSTLLRAIALLEAVSEGEILRRGEVIVRNGNIAVDEDRYRQRVGMVFQEFNLWANKTILENVIEAPIHVLGLSRKEGRELGYEWLARLGLEDQVKKFPPELSGGQRQRVALARTFAMDPEVVLLDEITSALDVGTTARILALLDQLRSPGRTFIFVTHHLNFAKAHMDRVAVLVGGAVVEVGSPLSVIENSAVAETQDFLRVVREAW